MRFKVIDPETGVEADPEMIVLNEEWADGLMWMDMEGFALCENGSLILMDECGGFCYCPPNRFVLIFEPIADTSEVLK